MRRPPGLEQIAQGERGVEALAEKTGLSVANCSRHLQQLRRAGLVASRREGKAVIYRLTDTRTLRLMDLLARVAGANLAEVGRILRGLAGDDDLPEPIGRAELAVRLAMGTVTLLDVRPTDEHAMGHIPGAVNVLPGEIGRVVPDLDPNTEIVAYCRGPYCIFAHQAVAALRQRGFRARRIDGGFPEWQAERRAIEVKPRHGRHGGAFQ